MSVFSPYSVLRTVYRYSTSRMCVAICDKRQSERTDIVSWTMGIDYAAIHLCVEIFFHSVYLWIHQKSKIGQNAPPAFHSASAAIRPYIFACFLLPLRCSTSTLCHHARTHLYVFGSHILHIFVHTQLFSLTLELSSLSTIFILLFGSFLCRAAVPPLSQLTYWWCHSLARVNDVVSHKSFSQHFGCCLCTQTFIITLGFTYWMFMQRRWTIIYKFRVCDNMVKDVWSGRWLNWKQACFHWYK